MNLFVALGLVCLCATRTTAQSSTTVGAPPTPVPTHTDRLIGWFNRTTLIQPQPSELPLADFHTGLESAAWRNSVFTALFFQPNLVIDSCGLVRTIAPDDIAVMELGVNFFSTAEHKFKRWGGDIKISDLSTKTLVARLDPESSQNIVYSSIYAWPITHMPRIGWYWDWVRWRDEQLYQWLGWQPKEEPRKWPAELDRVIELLSETMSCGDSVYGNRYPGLFQQVERNPEGTLTRRDDVWSATSDSATHSEL